MTEEKLAEDDKKKIEERVKEKYADLIKVYKGKEPLYILDALVLRSAQTEVVLELIGMSIAELRASIK